MDAIKNAIETVDLSKKYKDRTVVDNVNLSVKQGEIFALLGENGAGKTTIIKMLCCLLLPTTGDAKIMNFSILKDAAKIKQFMNISPQETAIAPNLTAKENLELIAEIYGSKRAEVGRKAEEMLTLFGLSDRANDKARTFSGGMQRRLNIAMALITNPKILFLDEPTLGLDVLARRELWHVIEKLKGNVTMILTTHYLEEAEALSDRAAIMAKGKIKAIGTAVELMKKTNTKNFEDAFISLVSESGVTK